jgi:hypothetical protein
VRKSGGETYSAFACSVPPAVIFNDKCFTIQLYKIVLLFFHLASINSE